MFKPESMSKVDLFILNEKLQSLTNLLYELKIIQFFDLKKKDFSRYELEDLNEDSGKLLELKSTINFLKDYYKKDTKSDIENPIQYSKELISKLDKVEKEIFKLEDLKKRERVKNNLKVNLKDFESKDLIIGYVPKSKKGSLEKLSSNKIKFRKYESENRIYFLIKTKKENLKSVNYEEFYIPKSLPNKIQEKLEKARAQEIKIKTDLTKLSNSTLRILEIEEARLEKKIKTEEVKRDFLKTENITVLSGYIPTKKVKLFRRKVEEIVGTKYHMEVEEAKEDAPTKLNNGPVSGNFESLLQMYSLPSYKEFDPTKLLLLVFPLFFGFILGDAIYGLVSLFFFMWLSNKMPQLKEFMFILQLSSISSIIWGVIYGEFAGFKFFGPFYGVFPRFYMPETLFYVAVIFGLIHINLGVLIGFFNNYKKNFAHAVYNHLSYIVLQIGIGAMVVASLISESFFYVIGAILIGLALLMIYLGHGFIGIIEVPSFFTNILSYARLMAVGLSSVAIAVLINELTLPLLSSGIIGIIAALILFSAAHIFNIILGNFESFFSNNQNLYKAIRILTVYGG